MSSDSSQQYTILRIKRKRNEEPLDALVIDSTQKRKKPRESQQGIFQFAQTLESSTWNEEHQKLIQTKIKDLNGRATVSAVAPPPLEPKAPKIPKSRPTKLTYTVVPTEEEVALAKRRRNRLAQPPKVLSTAKDASKDFMMYDAILSLPETSKEPSDEEMAKFLPMLQDYLTLHHIQPDSAPASSTHSRRSSSEDYVWDIFYHRPVISEEWKAISNNVALLTGLPPSLDETSDSDSDEEVEDEADEDSNDENWYANEYPEEESGSSSSDGSDISDQDTYPDDCENGNPINVMDSFSGWR